MKPLDEMTVGAISDILLNLYRPDYDPNRLMGFFRRSDVEVPEQFRPFSVSVLPSVSFRFFLMSLNGSCKFEKILTRLASPKEHAGDRNRYRSTVRYLNRILEAEGLQIILSGSEPIIRDLGTSEQETQMTPSQITDTKRWLEKIAAHERGDAEAVAEANDRGRFVSISDEAMLGGAEHNAAVRLYRNGLIEPLNKSWLHNPENYFMSLGIYAYRLTEAGREFLSINNVNSDTNPKRQLRAFITHGKKRDYIEGTKKVCRQLGIEPVVAIESPNLSRPVEDKVAQEMASSDIYIVLLTQDDGNAASPNATGELTHAAFSHPDRVIIFREPGVALPSNLGGRATGSLDGQWQFELMKELQMLLSQITQE